jgi:hypothetical protein
MHRMIDDYLVEATEFGPLLSERSGRHHLENLDAAWANSAEARVDSANHSLPQYCRIQ